MVIAIPSAQPSTARHGNRPGRRMLVPALLAAAIAGCSPYVYQDEVAKFSQGVGDVRTAFVASQEATEQAARQADRTRWRRDRAALQLPANCIWGATDATACALAPQGAQPRRPTLSQTEAARVGPLVRALAGYAASLAAVVDSADRAELDRATGELRASVVSLATTVDGAVGGNAADVAGPVVRVFAAAAGAYLDDRRFRALRAGVEAADPAVQALGDPIGRGLELLAEQRFIEVGDEVRSLTTEQNRAARARVSDQEYDALTAALDARVDTLDALRRSRPRQTATAMVEAHGRLRAAVADPETQMAAVIAALKRFTDAARELRDGLAGKTSQGS